MRGLVVAVMIACTSVARADVRRDWLDAVRHTIGVGWTHYDELRRAAAATGALRNWACTLRITVGRDGRNLAVELNRPSGLPELDAEALRVVREIALFPAPPPELIHGDDTLRFPFTFGIIGWNPPAYQGDAFARTPLSPAWEVGADATLERRGRTLAGSAKVASGSTYDREALSVFASRNLGRLGTLELTVPYELVRYHAADGDVSASGFGDLLWHVHARTRFGSLELASFLGSTIPTGATSATPIAGTTVVQIGSGTIEPDIGICLGYPIADATTIGACAHDRISFYANSYGYRDPSIDDYRLFASSAPFGPWLEGQAGVFFEDEHIAVAGPENTPYAGHEALFAEVSVWALLYRGLAARGTLELPIYETVDGTQLADSIRAMFALSYDFDR